MANLRISKSEKLALLKLFLECSYSLDNFKIADTAFHRDHLNIWMEDARKPKDSLDNCFLVEVDRETISEIFDKEADLELHGYPDSFEYLREDSTQAEKDMIFDMIRVILFYDIATAVKATQMAERKVA